VNLYPFEETVAKGADYDTTIENIDIGGPAMIRSAAKNHGFVNVVVDVEDYAAVIAQLDANGGQTEYTFRQGLAQTAYARTAAYDTAVSTWMAAQVDAAPRRVSVSGTLAQTLRYGENPHQSAAFYTDGSTRAGIATAKQHQGKELSYNNINDTDAAFELVSEFGNDVPACAIIKHANPCGVATGETLRDAYTRAFQCDQTSAFGGIIALNQTLDAATAEEITGIFTEVVIAPNATPEAMEIFANKRNLSNDPPGGRWLSCARQRHRPRKHGRPQGGNEKAAKCTRNGRFDVCVDRGEAREIKRDYLRQRRGYCWCGRRPDEPR
jgi:phosphoribosylaminoimidazolecarboxamide formyltransferase/IMP cyclohydrolase